MSGHLDAGKTLPTLCQTNPTISMHYIIFNGNNNAKTWKTFERRNNCEKRRKYITDSVHFSILLVHLVDSMTIPSPFAVSWHHSISCFFSFFFFFFAKDRLWNARRKITMFDSDSPFAQAIQPQSSWLDSVNAPVHASHHYLPLCFTLLSRFQVSTRCLVTRNSHIYYILQMESSWQRHRFESFRKVKSIFPIEKKKNGSETRCRYKIVYCRFRVSI